MKQGRRQRAGRKGEGTTLKKDHHAPENTN